MSPAPRLPQADIYVSKNVKCMLVIVNVFADGIRHIRAQLLSSRPRRALGSARASQATKQRPSDNRCHGPSTLAKLMLSQKKKRFNTDLSISLSVRTFPALQSSGTGEHARFFAIPETDEAGREEASGTQIGPSFILKDERCELPEARVK